MPLAPVAPPGVTSEGVAANSVPPSKEPVVATVAAATEETFNSEALARSDGAPADAALSVGDLAFEAENWVAARKSYEQARRLAPQDPAAYVGLSRVTLAEKSIPLDFAARPKDRTVLAALRLLQQALAKDADYGLAHLERGRVQLVLGDAAEATKAFIAAGRLLPKNAEAHGGMGVALLASGKAVEALAEFKEGVRLDPKNAARLANLGTAHMMLGQVSLALQIYQRVVQLTPEDARAQGDLGTALLAQGRPAEALPHLERAHRLAPDRATFLSNIGYAHQLQEHLDLAIASYRQALKLDSRLVSAWINLGTALAHQKKFDEAAAALNRALEIDPTDPRAKVNLDELGEVTRQAPRSNP